MISKKICMLGAFAVGKTSLVERYVNSIFMDKYLTTVGVKISKKSLQIMGKDISMILWDMEGKDDFVDINISYLRGTMGFFVVADLTRGETLDTALQIRKSVIEILETQPPNMLLLNKSDLPWEITKDDIELVKAQGIEVMLTSAKTGKSVDDAFLSLAQKMV